MIQNGDICFTMKHDDWASRVIAWFMRSKWSHSFLFGDISQTRRFIIQANQFECAWGNFKQFQDDPHVSYEVWSPIGASQALREKVVDKVEAEVGECFGWLQFISWSIHCLFERIGWEIPNFIRQGWVCDELVLAGANLYPVLKGIDPKSIHTQDLYKIVSQSGGFEKVASEDRA